MSNKAHFRTALVCACWLLLACKTATLDGEKPEYLQSFDPAKGFKPAQRDLTEVFLQIAGSLEYYGSPVPYMQHMAEEHQRIEALYLAKSGAAPKSYRPAYMSDEYLKRFAANWNFLSPKMGLEPFAKQMGDVMFDAIKGTRRTGTTIVEILNEHQKRVFDAMARKETEGADFDTLKAQLITRLELDKLAIDDRNYDIPRRDAVRSAIIMQGMTMKLFARIDQGLKPADAAKVKAAITSVFADLGTMAQSELQAGIVEWALEPQQATAKRL